MILARSALRLLWSSPTLRIRAARSATVEFRDHSRCALLAAAMATSICWSVAVAYSSTTSPVDGSVTAYSDALMMVCSLEDRRLGREANKRISEPHSAILYKSVAECNDRDEFPVGGLNAKLAPPRGATITDASVPARMRVAVEPT